jgi:hypothetical protein
MAVYSPISAFAFGCVKGSKDGLAVLAGALREKRDMARFPYVMRPKEGLGPATKRLALW